MEIHASSPQNFFIITLKSDRFGMEIKGQKRKKEKMEGQLKSDRFGMEIFKKEKQQQSVRYVS